MPAHIAKSILHKVAIMACDLQGIELMVPLEFLFCGIYCGRGERGTNS